MERFTISKSEKQTIYEIYRACRICGAGGGYRMPIVQNIVDLETSDVELRQKIQDCLQLEVRTDDRMPPLICELCVDKVNDFYEFLELSRQTNVRTRTRLGLPLVTARKGEPDSGDCILGVTEPLRDSPAPKAGPKCSKKIKKEPESVNVKVEAAPSPLGSRSSSVSSRSSRGRRPPSPPRAVAHKPPPVTQEKKRVKEKEKEQQKGKDSVRGMGRELQDLLQDSHKYDGGSLLVPRSMKRKETAPPRPEVVWKRKRTTTKEPIKEPVREPTPPPRSKPGPKSKKMAPKEDPKSRPVAPREDPKSRPVAPREEPKTRQVAPKEDPKSRQVAPKEDPKTRQVAPKEDPNIPVPLRILKSKSKLTVTPPKTYPPAKTNFVCPVCNSHVTTTGALTNHMKIHVPIYTKPHLACNPCGKWFASTEESAAHHRYHRAATFPYHCRRCFGDYRALQDYNSHIDNGLCMPYERTPDVRCERCWRDFVTRPLLDAHRCPGPDARPGGNCSKCSRSYSTLKSLKAHQGKCTYKKKSTGGLVADPDVLRRLKPMQVRLARCDALLRRPGPCRAAAVPPDHGLDKNYVYPYFRLKPVKSEPLLHDSTVAIHEPAQEPERDSYTHWDSEDSDSDNVIRKVDSLTTLCLKKLFSRNMIGKVRRKRKKIKTDAFDCDDFGISSDISDIISSLNDDLRNDGVRKNRKDTLTAIAINDIIGVPISYMGGGNATVARSSNSAHTDDRNDNDCKPNDRIENTNEKDCIKDLNDVQIENEGTDTVVSASDISTELNLIETEDQNTRSEACESMETDSKTENDLDSKKDDENVAVNNDEIRNFKSVDGQSNGNNLEECNDSAVQQEQLKAVGNDENTEISNSEIAIDSLDSHSKSDNVNENNDVDTRNFNNENANNDTEMSTDNSEIRNNNERNDVNNDLETQITNHESENTNDSYVSNHNLDTENNYNNDNETQNENNEDVQLNNEIDIQNDNLKTNHLETKSRYDSDMNNHLEAQNESDEAVSQNHETSEHNANFNTNHLDTEDSQNSEIEEASFRNSINNELNVMNGIHENNTRINHNFEENEKLDESKKVTKESPIKHSIENLISSPEKNPDKYIDEVISSIEDIINKNPRNEDSNIKDNYSNGENSNQMDDQMLMDALDTHIGEDKDKIEDKITLDDLLPKDNISMELDDISDDDFNFDA